MTTARTGVLFNPDAYGMVYKEDEVKEFTSVPISFLKNPVCIGRQTHAYEALWLINYVKNQRSKTGQHIFRDPYFNREHFDVRDVSAVQVSADIEGKRRYMDTWAMLNESDFWIGSTSSSKIKNPSSLLSSSLSLLSHANHNNNSQKPMRIYLGNIVEVVAMNMDDFWKEYRDVKVIQNLFEPHHGISEASREKRFDLPPVWTDKMTEYMTLHDFVHPTQCMLQIEEKRSKITFSENLLKCAESYLDPNLFLKNFVKHLSIVTKTPLKLIKRVDFDGDDKEGGFLHRMFNKH